METPDMPLVALHVAADHPAFAGHFPGRPLVPGVVLLALAQRAIETELAAEMHGLSSVKFLSPALPGDPLLMEFGVAGATVRFAIRSGTRQVATGAFVLGTGEQA
jgi:3-hydroxyacyl-[acyl-carrier-protein] dehydratase